MFWGRLAACSALRPLTGMSSGVDGFCIGTKLVHGQELSVSFSSSCVTTTARLGNSKTCGFFSALDSVRLMPSGFSVGQVWFRFVRRTKHELGCVSDPVSCESDLRLILCRKKRQQDRALGCEHPTSTACICFFLCAVPKILLLLKNN